MTRIQFGWVLNAGPKEGMPSQQYNEIYQQQVELMKSKSTRSGSSIMYSLEIRPYSKGGQR